LKLWGSLFTASQGVETIFNVLPMQKGCPSWSAWIKKLR
jgi:hypothetical protein